MNLMRPVLCAGLLLLAGCTHVSRPVFPRHYALVAPATPVPPPEHAMTGRAILQIARIDVPPWLRGNAMYYRLDYRHEDRVAAYARSDWLAPPARMLEPLIRDALARGGAWRAVLGPGTPANADVTLHVRLDDFSQVFASPQQSEGVLDATATLLDTRDDDAIAQRHFHVAVAASGADAVGGVAALNRASREFIVQLQGWLRAVPLRSSRAPPPER
ncbi:MAG: ABC-type transport auxiliary lipoprotein family protein [Rhodanobacteraceae bacterium]